MRGCFGVSLVKFLLTPSTLSSLLLALSTLSLELYDFSIESLFADLVSVDRAGSFLEEFDLLFPDLYAE